MPTDADSVMTRSARTRILGRVVWVHLRMQLRLLYRTPRALWSAFLLPPLLLVAIGLSGRENPSEQLQLVAGIIAFGVLSSAYVTHASSLVAARDRGVLKRVVGTPAPPAAFFTARTLASLLLTLAGAAATVVVAVLIVGAHLTTAMLPGLLVACVIGALCWTLLGTAASIFIPNSSAAWPLLSATYLPLVFVSGVFFPSLGEPSWLTQLVHWLPVQPLTDAIATVLRSGAPVPMPPLADLGILLGWGLLGAALALRYFRWDSRSERRGTLAPQREAAA